MTDDTGFKAERKKGNSLEEQGGYLPYRYVSGVGEKWTFTWAAMSRNRCQWEEERWSNCSRRCWMYRGFCGWLSMISPGPCGWISWTSQNRVLKCRRWRVAWDSGAFYGDKPNTNERYNLVSSVVSEQIVVVRLEWQRVGEWVGSVVSSSPLLLETYKGRGTEGLYYVHKITVWCSELENPIKCIWIFMYVDVFTQ